jgi:hypothetical protein
LVLLLTPELTGVARASRDSADWRNVDGVRAAIDSLRPGVTALFAFGEGGAADDIRLSGHQISCSDGNGTISMPVTWALPNDTLSPSLQYRLSLADGVLVVQGV